jgi:sulfur-oxidizing protein SoxZ
VPRKARRGEVIEIKTLLSHPMETGYRRDNVGNPIPRDIISTSSLPGSGMLGL